MIIGEVTVTAYEFYNYPNIPVQIKCSLIDEYEDRILKVRSDLIKEISSQGEGFTDEKLNMFGMLIDIITTRLMDEHGNCLMDLTFDQVEE